VTLFAEWRIVSQPLVFQTDSRIHEFWMRRFEDPALFHDPLTQALLRTGYIPPGTQALYWLASRAVDPVSFGEWLPVVLAPLCAWLVFRIVRLHTSWRPAPWIAAALFLLPWDLERFSGGHSRAFGQPVVLLALYLILRRRAFPAAIVPPLGMLFYPPAALVALAVLALSTLTRAKRFLVDPVWGAAVLVSAVGVAIAAYVPRLVSGHSMQLITRAQAHRYPEFGPHGQMHFFTPSLLEYLRNGYSGFGFKESGSILAIAALSLVAIRPRNVRLIRWEVWAMAIASLVLYGVAQAVLFRLYLPQRYAYPLIPFFAIVIAVALRPTFEAVAARGRVLLALAGPLLAPAAVVVALTVFPLGPRLSLGALGTWLGDSVPHLLVTLALAALLVAIGWAAAPHAGLDGGTATLAALLAGAALVGFVAFAGGDRSPAIRCGHPELYGYLETLPKNAVIAGDPVQLDCIPIAARRAVVISRKLYQPWEVDYFHLVRRRMFRMVEAYYGGSLAALVDLRRLYGANYLLVRRPLAKHARLGLAPFTGLMAGLLRQVPDPAVLRLPSACRTWHSGHLEVYDLGCAAAGATG